MLHLRWPETADADLDHYEVRRGTTWTLGERVYAGPLPECTLEQNWAAESYLVRARNAGGRSGASAAVAVTSALPNGWTAATGFPRDEAGLPWTGTHSGTTTSGGYLVLDTDVLAGTYSTAVIDTGSSVYRRWTCYRDAAVVDDSLTWDDATFAWDSPEGQARTWDGAEPVSTSGGVDLETTWDDLTGTWDSYSNRTWNGLIGSLGHDALARVEAAFSDDNVSYTAWGLMRPHMRKARYAKFRVKLARRTTDFAVQVRALYMHAAAPP